MGTLMVDHAGRVPPEPALVAVVPSKSEKLLLAFLVLEEACLNLAQGDGKRLLTRLRVD